MIVKPWIGECYYIRNIYLDNENIVLYYAKTARNVLTFCLHMPSATFGGYFPKINGQYKHVFLKFRKT